MYQDIVYTIHNILICLLYMLKFFGNTIKFMLAMSKCIDIFSKMIYNYIYRNDILWYTFPKFENVERGYLRCQTSH